MVIDGNGAVISGLSAVPADRWKEAGNGVYELPFWPMSNMYKHYAKQDYWLPESRIFFVDGKAAANLTVSPSLRHSKATYFSQLSTGNITEFPCPVSTNGSAVFRQTEKSSMEPSGDIRNSLTHFWNK